MKISTRAEILEILRMPEEEFRAAVMPQAYEEYLRRDGRLIVTSMLGYSNICRNQCLYCGMRAGNSGLTRYRIEPDDVIGAVRMAHDAGFSRVFLISGEDPKYGFDNLLRIVRELHVLGMFISLAAGELPEGGYDELAQAGVNEYVLKFEMSQREVFNRLNPSTDFDRRMADIAAVQRSGMLLASGNIIGYPGHTAEMCADDILLMKQLGISWAPVIPYLPAAGTPLAQEGGPGELSMMLKEVAVLRLMMPEVRITAQQPGKDLKKGLADAEGNLDAVRAGANVLFCDLLPQAQARSFRVIDDRNVTGTEHIRRVAEVSGMTLSF